MCQICANFGHADQLLALRKELKRRTMRDRRTGWEEWRMREKGLHFEGDGARLNQVVGSGKSNIRKPHVCLKCLTTYSLPMN
jgi:hypothetical protein